MKKFLLLFVLIFGLKSISQTVLENYPSASTSILQSSNFINFNTKMYYFGRTSGYQWSLYSTDGTTTGNQVVKNLSLQVANIIPQDIDAKYNDYKIIFNNKLYFTANSQLWQSDGTSTGTVLFGNLNGAKYFKIFNGKLYFSAESSNGREVWSTDGTVSGTSVLKDIYPGTNPSVDPSRDPHFTIFNNQLFFVANDGINGYELWSTDGTSAGTNLFTNLRVFESESNAYNQGAFTVTSSYSTQPFVVCNNKMYFVANSDFSNQYGFQFRLFQTDGTVAGTTYVAPQAPAGTSLTTNFISGVNGLTAINNDLFCFGAIYISTGGGGVSSGSGIFKIDTANQISQVGTVVAFAGDSGSGPETEQGAMKLFNGEYYFIGPGATSSSNVELCKMNPTTFAVTQVSGPATPSSILFNTNNGFSRLLLSQEWDGKLYFMKADAVAGQLFSTTGTLASTTQVAKQSVSTSQIFSSLNFGGSGPKQLNNFASGLYFSANIGTSQPSTWRFYNANLLVNENINTNFQVYPNPSSNLININSDENLKSVTIYDVLGNDILNKNSNQTNDVIDVSQFNSGLYFVKIQFENGRTTTQKIIKK